MPKYSYSHHSSPVLSEDDDPDVESIISQATDLCALEQIAALNTCHVSDSYLPTQLEARFSKLKSFPGANPQPRKPQTQCHVQEKENVHMMSSSSCQKPELLPAAADQDLHHTEAAEISAPAKPESKNGLGSSPSLSLGSSREDSPSPPRQTCCFGCSPKRGVARRQGKDDHKRSLGKNYDEFLSDISGFTSKKQQRKLEKALKEQEKASQEAEKMVRWVKQVSARMNVDALDELLGTGTDEELK